MNLTLGRFSSVSLHNFENVFWFSKFPETHYLVSVFTIGCYHHALLPFLACVIHKTCIYQHYICANFISFFTKLWLLLNIFLKKMSSSLAPKYLRKNFHSCCVSVWHSGHGWDFISIQAVMCDRHRSH